MQVEKPFRSYTSGKSRKTFDENFDFKVKKLKDFIKDFNKYPPRRKAEHLRGFSSLAFMYDALSRNFVKELVENLHMNFDRSEKYFKGNYKNLIILSDLFNIKIEFDEIL